MHRQNPTHVGSKRTYRNWPLLMMLVWVSHVAWAVPDTPPGKEMVLDLGAGVTMEFVWLDPGSFHMGRDQAEMDEGPVREVTFSRGFWMGKYEVTQAQYEQVLHTNPSSFVGAGRPVEGVTYSEALRFLATLAKLGRVPGGHLARLPTEAEWECACRAGTDTQFAFGDDPGRLADYGWFRGNSAGSTHLAGAKKPNGFGLYDMHGNVWEWCEDWYDADQYALIKKETVDPRGPKAGWARVLRGGSWNNSAPFWRCFNRFRYRPWWTDYTVGFRVVVIPRK